MNSYNLIWKIALIGKRATGRAPSMADPNQMFAFDVTLKASDGSTFAANYEWVNALPVAGRPDVAKVSRLAPGHFPVQIKRKSTGAVEARLDVWVVASKITAQSLPDRIEPIPRDKAYWPAGGFVIQRGYKFLHDILPATIITAADRPDLTGAPSVRPPDGRSDDGNELGRGADKKWDTSRIVRQKVLNPNLVTLLGPRSYHGNFASYPSMGDGDGRPAGAQTISFEDWLVVGNDDFDAKLDANDDNPYDRPTRRGFKYGKHRAGEGTSPFGKLQSFDLPQIGVPNHNGSDRDTVEWRVHFQEFTRLEISGKCYLISERFQWRVHFKFIKFSGQWRNNASDKALDNEGFRVLGDVYPSSQSCAYRTVVNDGIEVALGVEIGLDSCSPSVSLVSALRSAARARGAAPRDPRPPRSAGGLNRSRAPVLGRLTRRNPCSGRGGHRPGAGGWRDSSSSRRGRAITLGPPR